MLATRVIPTLLTRGRELVKGERFNSWRCVGVTAQAVRIHQSREVDELCLLDIAATREGRGPDLSLVSELAEVCFMPLTVGGGVTKVSDVRDLLRAGADKIAIGEAAWTTDVVRQVADVVGCQAVVVTCDVVERLEDVVGARCMREVAPGRARWAQEQGAGEILLTSVDREGTLQGYDLDLIKAVSEAVTIPVVAHGGCSGYEDMLNAIKAGAHAVAAGALFLFTEATPLEAARYLKKNGIEARV